MEELYKPQEIEHHTQTFWHDKNSFKVTEDINKEKFYCLSMMPYPSGSLHIGHVRNYTIGDVIARYKAMLGKNVLHPMSWDAFGLPAENAAIQHQVSPQQWTQQNIQNMRSQMQQLGLAIDWGREISTCDPDYYRWEQWLFLRLFEKGLAYRKNAEVNWDPVDQTVLANEQVIDGRGWRSGAKVERREIPQWFLKITSYAEELLNDLDELEHWPEQVKTMQRNWIGRSEGIEIQFEIESHHPISIYTTRPDTIYGSTFIALAPMHPLVQELAQDNEELQAFIESCRHIKLAEAEVATIEKKGLPLPLKATHPITKEKMPVWVANFVLMEYGAGAIMAVPAHDTRDFEFAQKYDLAIQPVIQPQEPWNYAEEAYVGDGTLINSQQFDGLETEKAIDQISTYLQEKGLGKKSVHYRLRDWSISRQRYWGAPIPIIYCEACGIQPVPYQDLPVQLPEKVKLTGVTSPLKTTPSFYKTKCPACGGDARRETDTFDTFMESSWYYARLTCKKLHKAILDGRANYWLPVDQYVGGIEHAVLHLLYARFIHKVLRDEGFLNSNEPFTRLLTQGMVLKDGHKMSKSKGNVVDPQPLFDKYGADTVRLFMMFAAPPEQSLEWSDSGVEGSYRFLKRVWAFGYEHREIIRQQNRMPTSNILGSTNWENTDIDQKNIFRQIYEILEQAKYDYERQQYNTVVSGCMKILNLLTKLNDAKDGTMDIQEIVIHKGFSILLRLLAPITPHIAHQLWLDLHFDGLILDAEWPKSSSIIFKVDAIEMVVQINGKLRSKIKVPQGADQTLIEEKVKSDQKVQQALEGKSLQRIIIVPGKLVNVVLGK